jgi:hypothetical protein
MIEIETYSNKFSKIVNGNHIDDKHKIKWNELIKKERELKAEKEEIVKSWGKKGEK